MGDTTSTTLDLGPQALIVARLAEGVREEQLGAPTPCPEYAVRNLLGHLVGLARAFRDAARKDLGPTTNTDPGSSLPDLQPDWRAELPKLLTELAEAWRDPSAWTGETRAGGVDLPGEVAGLVATNELVIHGWDLARATGQHYAPDEAALQAARDFLAPAADDPDSSGLFGPAVPVPDEAPVLDRVIGLSGRDPSWTARG
ncbi:TIGR03086 family protein [Streptomyces sp. HC44]|uniref:TIGR03086 family protein n=1 Tax=Streptomyces scabichelini TaxID=2711217 RepID=A0A6G4V9F9_9ACTN|nr:TIGR03086 family metal-binding protein [Streptomyces scabichelini]NGO10457.1 TIGR03086 family protein [Streptomyces scabichelini]